MDRIKKNKKQFANHENDRAQMTNFSKCSLCRKRFKTHSHFDAICDLCWADNEMKPYIAFGGYRGLAS